jgi:hypothetical protein
LIKNRKRNQWLVVTSANPGAPTNIAYEIGAQCNAACRRWMLTNTRHCDV